jgi:hypothetical protein
MAWLLNQKGSYRELIIIKILGQGGFFYLFYCSWGYQYRNDLTVRCDTSKSLAILKYIALKGVGNNNDDRVAISSS